jgi:hypothetical protein
MHFRPPCRNAVALFRLLLLVLSGEGKPLCLFAACRAFPNIISTLAVSHKILTVALSPPVPSCFTASRAKTLRRKTDTCEVKQDHSVRIAGR